MEPELSAFTLPPGGSLKSSEMWKQVFPCRPAGGSISLQFSVTSSRCIFPFAQRMELCTTSDLKSFLGNYTNGMWYTSVQARDRANTDNLCSVWCYTIYSISIMISIHCYQFTHIFYLHAMLILLEAFTAPRLCMSTLSMFLPVKTVLDWINTV